MWIDKDCRGRFFSNQEITRGCERIWVNVDEKKSMYMLDWRIDTLALQMMIRKLEQKILKLQRPSIVIEAVGREARSVMMQAEMGRSYGAVVDEVYVGEKYEPPVQDEKAAKVKNRKVRRKPK